MEHFPPNATAGGPRMLDVRRPGRLSAPFLRHTGRLLDKTLLTFAMTDGRFPPAEALSRLAREIRELRDFYAARGWLDDPRSFHRTPERLDGMRRRRAWHPRVRYERLTFASDYEVLPDEPGRARWASYVANHLAHAYVVEHADPGRPWLVCAHGLGMGDAWTDFAGFRARFLHETLGLNLLFPVMPLHGPRLEPGMKRGSLISYDLVDTLHGVAQAVHDTRRLIAWLRERGAQRIGMFGLSLGAYVTTLVSAFEPLDLAIAGIPLCDVPALFVAHSTDEHRHDVHAHQILGPEVREIYRLVAPEVLGCTVPLEARFVFAAVADGITTPQQAAELWAAWDKPTIHWYEGGHVSFFWSREVQSFVDSALAARGFDRRG
jgi:predicted esterase